MGKKWDVIDITMLCLTFYEPPIVQHEVFLAYKYVVIVALFVKYCKEIKAIWKIIFPAIMYGLVTLISTAANAMSINTVVASFIYGMQIVTIFIVSH